MEPEVELLQLAGLEEEGVGVAEGVAEGVANPELRRRARETEGQAEWRMPQWRIPQRQWMWNNNTERVTAQRLKLLLELEVRQCALCLLKHLTLSART